LRGNGFYSTPLQFFLVDVLSLAVIIQALFIIGGYDRNTQVRILTYTAEHILAIAANLWLDLISDAFPFGRCGEN
jgi:hypothetical protein